MAARKTDPPKPAEANPKVDLKPILDRLESLEKWRDFTADDPYVEEYDWEDMLVVMDCALKARTVNDPNFSDAAPWALKLHQWIESAPTALDRRKRFEALKLGASYKMGRPNPRRLVENAQVVYDFLCGGAGEPIPGPEPQEANSGSPLTGSGAGSESSSDSPT